MRQVKVMTAEPLIRRIIEAASAVKPDMIIMSFTGCRSRVWVASMGDVISSKRSLGRPKDLAVLPLLEATLHEQERMSQQGETGS